jgi:predicted DCC family thiol-disulfide oxidoreductase YuxK
MPNQSKMKVYYNSACPVCKAGIESQMGKENRCDIQWNDVHQKNNIVSEVNADLEFVRERLHVIDEKGDLQIGFDAFLAIWRNSPNENWKSKLFGLPLVKPLCCVAYNLFATALYKWNKFNKHW